MWDLDGAFPQLTSEYCRKTCGGKRCADCLQPRILPDAEAGVAAYMAVSTQWRAGFGGRTGLDYNAVLCALKLHLRAWRRDSRAFDGLTLADVLADVQIVESAMLAVDAERHAEDETRRAMQ